MTTWPSTRRKAEGTLHLLSLRLPYGPLPPLHFYIASLSLSLFPTRLFQGLITPRSVTPRVKLSLIWTNENACILQPPVHTLFPHAPRASYALDETRPPRNNNSNFLSPRNSRSTRPLLITRTYAPASSPYVIHSLFPPVQNRKKISNSDLSARKGERRGGAFKRHEKSGRDCLIPSAVVRSISSIPLLPNHLPDSRPLCALQRIVSSASGAEGYRALGIPRLDGG